MEIRDAKIKETLKKKIKIKWLTVFIALNTCVITLFGCLIFFLLDSEISTNLAMAHVTYSNIREMLSPILVTTTVLFSICTIILNGVGFHFLWCEVFHLINTYHSNTK